MALKRLTPTIKNLGYLRLWQDDLAEIIALVQRLENVKITFEADKYELLDGEADLPSLPVKLGNRLRYFTIKATQSVILGIEDGLPDNQPPDGKEILAVRLARNSCQIEAADPDLQTGAVINLIEEKARKCRRVPLWFPRLWVVGPPATAAEFWGGLIAIACVAYLFFAAISMGSYFRRDPGQQGDPVAVVHRYRDTCSRAIARIHRHCRQAPDDPIHADPRQCTDILAGQPNRHSHQRRDQRRGSWDIPPARARDSAPLVSLTAVGQIPQDVSSRSGWVTLWSRRPTPWTYADGSVSVLPRTRRRSICDSRNTMLVRRTRASRCPVSCAAGSHAGRTSAACRHSRA